MIIGQIAVLCDLSDTRCTVCACRPSLRANESLNLVSVPNDAEGINKHNLHNIWAIVSQKIMYVSFR